MAPLFSIIVPVYNRPEELEELLTSIQAQSFRNFEVIVVEDGSTRSSEQVVERFSSEFPIQYHVKPNAGPGPARNVGFTLARGQYFIILDSDCILPPQYLSVLHAHLERQPLDAWGGPDRGHAQFTSLQQAMAFTMSAFLTTGGIRGGKQVAASFQPRSFNMGVSRVVWQATGGFTFRRYAEDIEWSIRIRKAGYRIGLIEEAFVYHKRRTSLTAFFRQVWNFGMGRVHVGNAHPGEIKMTHWLPSIFTLGLFTTILLLLLGSPLGVLAAILCTVYFFALAVTAWSTTHSVTIALLAIPSAAVQLTGYGLGFLSAWLRRS